MESSFADIARNETIRGANPPLGSRESEAQSEIANADCSFPHAVNQSLSAAAELVLRAPGVYLFVVYPEIVGGVGISKYSWQLSVDGLLAAAWGAQ